MELDSLLALRPFLFHLTSRRNVGRIRRSRKLVSATSLLREFGRDAGTTVRRRGPLLLGTGDSAVELRDQDPLHMGNISFSPEFSFSDLLRLLNARIFFWPGRARGPIESGMRHFQRYVLDRPALLRIPFLDLLEANRRVTPLLCRFNSGSPRCSSGKKSPRGPDTFVEPDRFAYPPSRVIEVTFEASVNLPSSTEISGSPQGPWRKLEGNAPLLSSPCHEAERWNI
jgi:hypothetical protein